MDIEKWGDSPFEVPREVLQGSDPELVARRAGALWKGGDAGGRMIVPVLGAEISVSFPEITVEAPAQLDSFPLKLLTVLYLSKCTDSAPAGRWVAYRDLPNARFYEPVFARSVEQPLAGTFGSDPGELRSASGPLGGRWEEYGDAACSFELFPKTGLLFIIWHGDEEFPARAQTLFDEGSSRHLNAFDLRMGAQEISSRLIRIAGRT